MSTQPNSQFYFNRANVVKVTPAVVKARESYVPPIEVGVVCRLDHRYGKVGQIGVMRKDGSVEEVDFLYHVGMSRAVVKGGRIGFELIESSAQHEPKVGLEVRLIAGYLPNEDTPITFHWCSEQSWARAEEELVKGASEISPAVTVTPKSHDTKRKARGKTGRLVSSKVINFPKGDEVAKSEQQTVAS